MSLFLAISLRRLRHSTVWHLLNRCFLCIVKCLRWCVCSPLFLFNGESISLPLSRPCSFIGQAGGNASPFSMLFLWLASVLILCTLSPFITFRAPCGHQCRGTPRHTVLPHSLAQFSLFHFWSLLGHACESGSCILRLWLWVLFEFAVLMFI